MNAPVSGNGAAGTRASPVAQGIDPGEPSPATLQGRRIYLRPVWPDDVSFLYSLSTGPELGYRWRYRGQVPSLEAFSHELWAGILCQFVVALKSNDERLGLVLAHSADLRNGYVHIAVLMSPAGIRRALGVEAGGVFTDYLFTTYPFRKLYAESLSYTLKQVESSMGKGFEVEGCLRKHEFYDGRYWDLYMVAFYREQWEEGRAARDVRAGRAAQRRAVVQ